MSITVGDIVSMTITKVEDYACWGSFHGQTGFVHCVEWSREKPVPPSRQPKIGDKLQAKVFRLVNEPQSQLPADVTFGGTIAVDFAASVALLDPPQSDIVSIP
jgi:hypothetical protein